MFIYVSLLSSMTPLHIVCCKEGDRPPGPLRGGSSHLTFEPESVRPDLASIQTSRPMQAVLVRGPTATQNSPFFLQCSSKPGGNEVGKDAPRVLRGSSRRFVGVVFAEQRSARKGGRQEQRYGYPQNL